MLTDGLSERVRRFVEAFMGPAAGNGTEAARLAGYKGNAKVLGVQASRLLAKASVQSAVRDRQARLSKRVSLSTEQALANVSAIASATPEIVTSREILKANELILRVHGALSDKHSESRITVNIGFLVRAEPATATVDDYIEVTPRQAQLVSAEDKAR